MTHFLCGKWRLSCTITYIHAAQIFIDPEYLDSNPPKKSEISQPVCEKTDYMCFPLYLLKVENGEKLLETKTMINGRDAAEF